MKEVEVHLGISQTWREVWRWRLKSEGKFHWKIEDGKREWVRVFLSGTGCCSKLSSDNSFSLFTFF